MFSPLRRLLATAPLKLLELDRDPKDAAKLSVACWRRPH